MEKSNVVAIVVTYNRKELLLECLNAILNQTIEPKKIVIIDNHSTDNTFEYLKSNQIIDNDLVEFKRLEQNIGGSGGFYEGFKESQKYNPEWLWIMDDDTIPQKECLEKLVKAKEKINEDVSYLASAIYGENNEFMNVPNVNVAPSNSGYPDWYKYLTKGMVKIREATFVSLLINNEAVKRIGFPVRDYFIWGDDTEYTLRLNRHYGNAYFVGDSIAIHKRKLAKKLSIYDEDNLTRIGFYYYFIRNNLINKKEYYGKRTCLGFFVGKQVQSLLVLIKPNSKYKLRKFITIHKALFAFVFSKYDKNAFKNRLDMNVKYK